MQKQHQGKGDTTGIEEREWTVMGARWNSLYRQKDIYFKQQEAQRKDIKEEP